MGHLQELIKLLQSRVARIGCPHQQVIEIVQSFPQWLNLVSFAFNKNLQRQHFIGWVVFGDQLHAIVSVGLSSLHELASFHCYLYVLIQVSVQELRAFLFRFV